MTERKYGDVWKNTDKKLWDDMWAAHAGSPMTEAVLAEALKVDRLIEVGCGAGHMLAELIKRGWSKGATRAYQGFEIGRKPAEAARKVLGADYDVVGRIEAGDFMDTASAGMVDEATLLIARGVVQHHAHWSLLPLAALRFVPRVVLGIGYTNTRSDRHTGGWQPKGCYDVHVSIPLLKIEAAAMGMKLVRCEPMMRGNRRELFVVLERGQ